MTETPVSLTPLSEDECWELLAARQPRLGRIAFRDDHAVVVYPMNYAVANRAVYLRTDPKARLATAVGSQNVVFEVDDVDVAWERGWSVLAHGRLHEVVDAEELQRHRELRLRTWAPSERLHLLRLNVSHITGRRIT